MYSINLLLDMQQSVEFIIRKTISADLIYINQIQNHAIANTNAYLSSRIKRIEDTQVWFDEHNTNESYFALTAEIVGNSVVAGWACLSAFRAIEGFAPTAEVSVYTHVDYRGKGIASKLLATLIDEARRRQFHNLISFITVDNQTSIRLHDKLGFEKQGLLREVAFKNGVFHDVIVLGKLL